MNLDTLIRAVQKEVGAEIDGRAGPETWGKIYNRVVGVASDKPTEVDTIEAIYEPIDVRSEGVIARLSPPVRRYARALVHSATREGIKLIVTSGTRSYEEQNALYAQGRTAPGNIVTKVRGGHSSHNHGIAFDVTVFVGATPVWESSTYKVVGALGRALGLTWGGDWVSFVDEPHFELRPKWAAKMSDTAMLAELRRRHDAGIDAFT